MNKVRVRTVAPRERDKLRRWKRQRTNSVNQNRARVILLSSGRIGNREIARRTGYSPQWVRVIIHRFNHSGTEGIAWYPYFHNSHGPKAFTADIVEQIAGIALASPRALIGLTQWSLSKLREYLMGEKILGHISLEWLRTLLRRAGIHWRRTKTRKESTDPEFAPK